MADIIGTQISALPAVTTPLAADLFATVNTGVTKKVTLQQLADYITGLPAAGGHVQNTDQFLDFGGPKQVAVAEIRDYIDDYALANGVASTDSSNELAAIHRWTINADDVVDGPTTNFFYTEARFDASLATKTTDDLAEGVTNKYFTNERAQDAVGGMMANTTGLTWNYNDASNLLSVDFDPAAFTLDQFDPGSFSAYTDEEARDAISLFIQNTTNIAWTHDDIGDTFTPLVQFLDTTNFSDAGVGQWTNNAGYIISVNVDSTTVTGDGVGTPLSAVQQVADLVTITGTGTVGDEFVAVQQVADGTTITGAGTVGDPFVATAGIAPTLQTVTDNGDITTNEIEINNTSGGIILRSPNNTRYRVTVLDSGNLNTTAI